MYKDTNFITGIRFYASIMVLVVHGYNYFELDLGSLITYLANLGKHGVEVFFVVSGFTIAYQCFARDYTAKRFVESRVKRIISPYFPLLILLFCFPVLRDDSWILNFKFEQYNYISDLIAHLFFIGIPYPILANTIVGVEWTLHVEMAVYIFCFFLLRANNLERISRPNTYIFLLVLSIVFNVFVVCLGSKAAAYTYHFSVVKWLHLFSLGMIAFKVRYQHMAFPIRNLFISFTLIVIIGLFSLEFFVSNMFALGTFFLLIKMRDGACKMLDTSIVQKIGGISFSIYLIHLPVFKLLKYLGINNILLVILGCLVFAKLWNAAFEVRFYRILMHFKR